jgi:hypothetical protein
VTWTPTQRAANWLKGKFSAVEQYDDSWTFFNPAGSATGWIHGTQGELIQSGNAQPLMNNSATSGFFAVHRDQMLGGQVVLRGMAISSASEGHPISCGIIYNYQDNLTFKVLMVQQTTGFGGSPTGGFSIYYNVDLTLYDVFNGVATQRYFKRLFSGNQVLPQQQPFKLMVDTTGVTFEIGPVSSPTTWVDNDQTVALNLKGQRIGLYCSSSTAFWRLEEIGLSQQHVLLPSVYGSRTRARLLVRRDGVRWANCATTAPQLRFLKDWETWFWVLPALGSPYDSYYFGANALYLGIGSGNLL